jgi:hypothetical protein
MSQLTLMVRLYVWVVTTFASGTFGFRQGMASQPAEKGALCHPEPALFAGEGSAVRKNAQEKADS